MKSIRIKPLDESEEFDVVVSVPGSKSITNRALVCSALANGRTVLTGVLKAEDTEVMVNALRALGVSIDIDWPRHRIEIEGFAGNLKFDDLEIDVAGSGTTMRFLTSMLSTGVGTARITGNSRMLERPIGDLVEALNQLGADVRCELSNDCPPVLINASKLHGGDVSIRGDMSSQFLSGLLMAVPFAAQSVRIKIQGELVSAPFVEMTLRVMHEFGIQMGSVESRSDFDILVNQNYRGIDYHVEPDATAASYFWGAAAVCGGSVTVRSLSRLSIQGDVQFVEALEKMGCQTFQSAEGWTVKGPAQIGIDINMGEFSDTVQTLAVVAIFVEGPTTIRGVEHNRHKESDRIVDLARELRKLGAEVEELRDGLRIIPNKKGKRFEPVDAIETYNDHRMAMSFAIAGLGMHGVTIKDPGCVAKTFPDYFDRLDELRKSLRKK